MASSCRLDRTTMSGTELDAAAARLFANLNRAGSVMDGWSAILSVNLDHLIGPTASRSFAAMAASGATPITPKVEALSGPQPGFAVILEPPSGRTAARSPGAPAQAQTLLTISGAAPAGIEALRPSHVAASLGTAPSGGQALQVYIATADATPPTIAASTRQLPAAGGADWSLIISGQRVFQDLIVSGYNDRSQHLKLEAIEPDSGSGNAWFARTVHRILFQGTVSWGDDPPFARQHSQIGLTLRGSPSGRLAVAPYRSQGSNVDLQISAEQSYRLALVGAAETPQLRLVGSAASVEGTGIAEATLVPIAQALLGQELKDDLEAVSLSACTDLLRNNLALTGVKPVIRQVGLPGDLVLLGELIQHGGTPTIA
jgi:hypothetical protein